LACRGLGVPVVISERNNPAQQKVRPAWSLGRRWLYRLADRMVTPTQGVLACFPEPIRHRAEVIPNPLAVSTILPKPMAGRRPKALIAAGRLDHQKGFDLLLHAFKQVADRFPDWMLVIRGEGPERAALESLRDALGLADRVSLPGVTASPTEWVCEGSIFVLSSRYEGFANVVTEAMLAGLPIVAFNCPFGPGEILQHDVDGLLVPPEDLQGLATAMARLMADATTRRQLGQAAATNVRRFQLPEIMAKWDRLVDQLLANRGWTGLVASRNG
jgi:glycosyltransferase involved in cell wall biosynthesis